MVRTSPRFRGFTLLELMVVVAILGILAAIAIPSFRRLLIRARQAEIPSALHAIRTSEVAYFGATNGYLAAAPSPALCTNGVVLPGDQKCSWGPFDADGNDLDMQAGFSAISWLPEGPVYGQYAVVVGCAAGGRPTCFTAEARSDIDGNGLHSVWEYARPDRNGAFAVAVNFGGTVPPIDETGAPVVEMVQKDFAGDSY